MEVVSEAKNGYGNSLTKMRKKIELVTNGRKIYTPSSVKSFTSNGHSGNIPCIVPPERQKTAVLSRRHTYNGKIPVDSRYISNTRRCRNRRPRRSVSEEGSLSSHSSSNSSTFKPLTSPADNDDKDENNSEDPLQIYQQGLHSLVHNERWQKEIALGNRVGFYRLYRDIGKGKFSKVKVAVHYLTKEKVVVKIVDKPKLPAKARRRLNKEISTLQSLRHPHLLRLFEVIECQTKLYLAMEYADGGDLFYRITTSGRFLEHEAKLIFIQITSALLYLHKQNVVYKDLRAEKVFFTAPNVVKLGDFSFSAGVRAFEDNVVTFNVISPYSPPELLRKEGRLGPSMDMWSLGVLLFLSVTAALPFKGDTPITIKKQVLNGRFTVPKHVSIECRTLIEGLLCQEPDKRMSINQIKSSDWLRAVPLPQPIVEKSKLYTTVEKETKVALSNLGIHEETLKEHESKEARSDVNGTFRILLHKHEKKYGYPFVACPKNGVMQKIGACPTFQSRTCTIL